MNPLILVGIFVVAAVLGYVIIRNVPVLLQTPLMSGMNALSGITLLGAMVTAGVYKSAVGLILSLIACALAMINIAGGFSLTNRMFRMFIKKENKQ